MNNGLVHIVHHIDTEGPLWESLNELFSRLKLIFGIDLEPTPDNLSRLQRGELIGDPKIVDEVRLATDPHTISFKRNWHEIEEMLLRVMSKEFRNKQVDSFGGGWIYNWHVMDHVGFIENPRHRDLGYLNIFDFYKEIIDRTNSNLDAIHWHFHPISFFRKAHVPATSFDNSMVELHQIICRRLIERDWFPVVNRAGFHTERIDANLFLEQWIPFDPSNISIDDDRLPKFQRDLAAGRFGDWRGAPTDWSVYHPDLYDWRQPGSCNRVIARVLNLKARHRNINETEITKAFDRASAGNSVYMGLVNHDWREMSIEIEEFRAMLSRVIRKFPDVKFKFSEAVSAFRNVLNLDEKEAIANGVDFEANVHENRLHVKITNGEPFGPQPYLALKTKQGDYFHDNFDFHGAKRSYSYCFDDYTISLDALASIGIAVNDRFGNVKIRKIKIN